MAAAMPYPKRAGDLCGKAALCVRPASIQAEDACTAQKKRSKASCCAQSSRAAQRERSETPCGTHLSTRTEAVAKADSSDESSRWGVYTPKSSAWRWARSKQRNRTKTSPPNRTSPCFAPVQRASSGVDGCVALSVFEAQPRPFRLCCAQQRALLWWAYDRTHRRPTKTQSAVVFCTLRV